MEISKNNSSRALADLEAAAPYELGQAASFVNALYPAYVRGSAYLLAHNATAAAAEFQKILDHPWSKIALASSSRFSERYLELRFT